MTGGGCGGGWWLLGSQKVAIGG